MSDRRTRAQLEWAKEMDEAANSKGDDVDMSPMQTRSRGGIRAETVSARSLEDDRSSDRRKGSGDDGDGGGGSRASAKEADADDGDLSGMSDDDDDSGPRLADAGLEMSDGWTCPPDKDWIYKPIGVEMGFDHWNNAKATHTIAGALQQRKNEEAYYATMRWWGRSSSDGMYCWLCETEAATDVGKRNTDLENITGMISQWSDKSPFFLCTKIHNYYDKNLLPHNRKIWTRVAIYTHITEHKLYPAIIVDENIRRAQGMIKMNERQIYHESSAANVKPQRMLILWHKTLEQSLKLKHQLKGSIR